MSAVTTWNILPSIRAPREGEVVARMDGSRDVILSPMEYVPGFAVWKVRLRGAEDPIYVRAVLNVWTEA